MFKNGSDLMWGLNQWLVRGGSSLKWSKQGWLCTVFVHLVLQVCSGLNTDRCTGCSQSDWWVLLLMDHDDLNNTSQTQAGDFGKEWSGQNLRIGRLSRDSSITVELRCNFNIISYWQSEVSVTMSIVVIENPYPKSGDGVLNSCACSVVLIS